MTNKSLRTIPCFIKGMKSKAGKKFNAYIILKDDCKSSFEFEKQKKK